MLDRILNEWLEDNARHRDSACGVLNLAIDLHFLAKSRLFDFEITYQRLKLLAEGYKVTISVFERISKVVSQRVDDLSKFLPDSRANRIERIEEKMRVYLRPQHLQAPLLVSQIPPSPVSVPDL